MPIKLPKGFTRRRSSGNVLDSIENPPAQSSFRVLDRNDVAALATESAERLKRKSFGPGRPSSQPLNRRQSSFEQDLNNSSRVNDSSSGGTSSEARYSYASTAPSSVENHSQDSLERAPEASLPYPPYPGPEANKSRRQIPSAQPPQPPKHAHKPKASEASFSVKGRTFSFSPNSSSNPTPKLSNQEPDSSQFPRQRAMTESSQASTATPQLDFDRAIGLGLDDADFGGDFNDLFSSKPRALTIDHTLPPPPPVFRTGSDSSMASLSPKPLYRKQSFEPGPERIDVARDRETRQSVGSPLSWPTNDSTDKLMASPPTGPQADDTVQKTNTAPSPDKSPTTERTDDVFLDSLRASQALALQFAPPAPLQSSAPQVQHDRTKHKSPGRSISPIKSREQSRDVSPYPPRRATTPQDLFGSEDDANGSVQDSTPKGTMTGGKPTNYSKPTQLPPRQRTPVPDLKGKNKVMTPAEFEQYRKEQAALEQDDDDQGQQSESSDDYEDEEDENERNRQIVRQRRKQEAHLAVYRQQMRKVTGDQATDLPGATTRPGFERSTQSTPNFMSSFSTTTPTLVLDRPSDTSPKPETEKISDDDDDDVPLGVLQAHGFPGKHRPPTRLSVASTGNIPRAGSAPSAYPSPPNATRNDASAGGGGMAGGLPPFARNLPQDPYVGASLVNSSNREPLQYNNQNPSSQHAGPLPPGGLVGVIAGEERAKAMRRGSPNSNGNFGQMGNTMGLPQQLQPPPLQQQMPAPVPQDQAATNNMMTQFMQMQMQWMQSMMQMQNMQQPPNMMSMPMPGMMQMPPGLQQPPQNPHQPSLAPRGGQQSRPMSLISHASNNPAHSTNDQQRPFANMARQGFGAAPQGMGGGLMDFRQQQQPFHSSSHSVYDMQAGYAPSIAPSERSNVGQPSRYRPVTSHGNNTSHAGGDLNARSRTNTMTGAFPTGLGHGLRGGRSTPGPGDSYNPQHQSTIRAVSKPVNNKKGTAASDEDEDEEGWKEMKRKREERKARQKTGRAMTATTDDRPTSAGSQQLGMEALYYDGGSFSPT